MNQLPHTLEKSVVRLNAFVQYLIVFRFFRAGFKIVRIGAVIRRLIFVALEFRTERVNADRLFPHQHRPVQQMKAVGKDNLRFPDELQDRINRRVVGNGFKIESLNRIILVSRNAEPAANFVFFTQSRQFTANIRQIIQMVLVLIVPHGRQCEAVKINFSFKRFAVLLMPVKAKRPRNHRRARIQYPVDFAVQRLRVIQHSAAAENYDIPGGDAVKVDCPNIMTFHAVWLKIVIVVHQRAGNHIAAVALIDSVDEMQRITFFQHRPFSSIA